MGSSSSKLLGKTASSTTRRYPAASSIPKSTDLSRPGPTLHPTTSALTSKNQAIDLDARDSEFGSRLSQIGPVQPTPTVSHSSTFARIPHRVVESSTGAKSASSPYSDRRSFPPASSNPALLIVQARDRIAKTYEEESNNLGKGSFQGRTLITAVEIKSVLSMRDSIKRRPEEIEQQLRLRQGLLGKLGPNGMVGNA